MRTKTFQKTLFLIAFFLLSTTSGNTANTSSAVIPKELHGFWQFRADNKGAWNGMYVDEKYVEYYYNLARVQKVTSTEKGYTLELDNNGKPLNLQIKQLPGDSAVFDFGNNVIFRCKRYDADPEMKVLTPEEYPKIVEGKWYEQGGNMNQPFEVTAENIGYEGQKWRILLLGKHREEYRALTERNGEKRLTYISKYGRNAWKLAYGRTVKFYTDVMIEDRSVYLAYNNVSFQEFPVKNVESVSVDFEVKDKIPGLFKLCISPLFPILNQKAIQAAVSSQTEGLVKKAVKGDTIFYRGGLISVFETLDKNKGETVAGGIKSNGVHDGLKYVTVRNKVKWDKGTYRVRVFKSGYSAGKPLPSDSIKRGVEYDINEYEHTWFTMTFTDLKNGKKWTIGSVAIPGKDVTMHGSLNLFLEIYGTPVNYGDRSLPYPKPTLFYKDIPSIRVVYKNFQANDKKLIIKDVRLFDLGSPKSRMGRAVWNKETGEVECEIGYKE